jgi:broad specificity phosphatase PhoE/nicotinamide riboside kinase
MRPASGQAFDGRFDPSAARIVPSRALIEVNLVRHGAVQALDSRVVRGQLDSALAPEGLRQHAALARWLIPRLRPDTRVFSSDLVRCRDLAERLGRPVGFDARLREQHMGAWEGRSWQSITEDDPERVRAYWSDYAKTPPPGGESLTELSQRGQGFWDEHSRNDGSIVLVTHIGVIRSLVCHWFGLPLDSALRLSPATASVTQVLLSEAGAVLNSLGERPWTFEAAAAAPSVEGPPRLALSGSAGTGKTTLGRRLAQELGVPFLEERMRARLEAGFDLHRLSPEDWRQLIRSDWEAQRREQELCAQGFVADRSSLDYAAFWLHYHLHEDSARTAAFIEEMAREAQHYQRILLCPHGALPLVDDGVRSTNPWTQLRFQSILEGLIRRHADPAQVFAVPDSADFGLRVQAVLAELGSGARAPQPQKQSPGSS